MDVSLVRRIVICSCFASQVFLPMPQAVNVQSTSSQSLLGLVEHCERCSLQFTLD